MAIIPWYVPVFVTVLVFIWIALLGRFLPGVRDELSAIIVLVLVWVLYAVFNFVEGAFNTLFGNPYILALTFLGVVAVIVVVRRKF